MRYVIWLLKSMQNGRRGSVSTLLLRLLVLNQVALFLSCAILPLAYILATVLTTCELFVAITRTLLRRTSRMRAFIGRLMSLNRTPPQSFTSLVEAQKYLNSVRSKEAEQLGN